MKLHDVGLIGLRVMGSNLALNMADNGYSVAIYNRTYSVGQQVIKDNPDANLTLFEHLKDFVAALSKPRKVILMVQAGKPVDYVIADLLPLLDQGDIIIDGGNSNFNDTIKRTIELESKGFRYLGVGISGGEEGARFGPAIMPGGSKDSYQYVQPIFEAIAAKADDGLPCVDYIGADGAGHYVKMVHNGIEYADMQLIAESYALLKHLGGLTNKELSEVFNEWNQGELDSYLIEITAQIFKTKDPETNNDLIDMILDRAAQKGTGKWTTEEALNTGTDASLLTSAVYARLMSSKKDERVHASKILIYDAPKLSMNKKEFVEMVRQALYASKIIAYAQGFDLMKNAAKLHNWDLNFESIAKIFRAGCIIRAKFLNIISDAYGKNKNLVNLMLDDTFSNTLQKYQFNLRKTIT
ncbi:MAG TPA: NADP-dependent phosphogluconate dehydrogenase, partial [Acholeplasmataceae bacterium]|nr:NADP-dependent phosphogluconate dehydrogenase [Acholeplasmataceae bacterium]